MSRTNITLINKVSKVLKYIEESENIDANLLKVDYQFSKNKAYLFVPPVAQNTGNGREQQYEWAFIEPLIDLTKKFNINFEIVMTENFQLCIKIYE